MLFKIETVLADTRGTRARTSRGARARPVNVRRNVGVGNPVTVVAQVFPGAQAADTRRRGDTAFRVSALARVGAVCRGRARRAGTLHLTQIRAARGDPEGAVQHGPLVDTRAHFQVGPDARALDTRAAVAPLTTVPVVGARSVSAFETLGDTVGVTLAQRVGARAHAVGCRVRAEQVKVSIGHGVCLTRGARGRSARARVLPRSAPTHGFCDDATTNDKACKPCQFSTSKSDYLLLFIQ